MSSLIPELDLFYSLNPIHEIHTNKQDIKIISPPKLMTIKKLTNNNNINSNIKVYHVATICDSTDNETKIAYSPSMNTLIGYSCNSFILSFSNTDLFDFSCFIMLNYSNQEIIELLFKTMSAD